MGHYLKKNESNEMPTHVLAFDTEAYVYDSIHEFRLGTAVYLRKTSTGWNQKDYIFNTIEEFYNIIDCHLHDKTILYVVAHNMKYDYRLTDLDKYLESRNFIIEQFVISEQFIICASRENNQKIYFIDTMNWFPHVSLKVLGHAFGLEKMEIPDNDFIHVTNEVLTPYYLNDSKIVALVVISFIEFITKYDLGNFNLTIAGQAFNAFRHRFMNEKSILLHGNQSVYDLEILSYRGGRCDIFKQGKFENIYKLDVNSMYPYIMKNYKFPTILLSQGIIKGNGLSNEDINDIYDDSKFVLANCDIEIAEPAIALKREKLIFPIGKIKSIPLTSPELKYVYEHGRIKNINEIVVYESNDIFSHYVDFFYDIKCNSENPIREMSKRFLNALYGRFAMKEFGRIDEITEINFIKEIEDTFKLTGEEQYYYYDSINDVRIKIMRIGNKIYSIKPKQNKQSKQSSPNISSAVTAYARCYLWDLIKTCGLNNVYYCDTDSIFTNLAGYKNLESIGVINEKQLGLLKLEGIGNCILRGPKDYNWTDIKTNKTSRVIKGVPSKAIMDNNGNFQYEQWVTGLNAYKNNLHGGIAIKKITKTMKRNYDKGTIDDNGNVHPFKLEEW